MNHRLISLSTLVLLLAGCGGSSGLPVAGTVTLDGAPLPWGQVYLHQQTGKSIETQHAIYEVRDGKFASAGSGGLLEGDYLVSILVHEGAAPPPPAAGEVEASPPAPTVVGEWEGTTRVAASTELKFDIKKADLKSASAKQRS